MTTAYTSGWTRRPGSRPSPAPRPSTSLGALDRIRATFRWKAGGLDAAGLQHPLGASALTLGGLLKHLALVEDYMFTTKLRGEPLGAPWDASLGRRHPTGSSAPPPTTRPEELYALWDGAVERSRARLAAALAEGGLDSSSTSPTATATTPTCAGCCST